MRKYLWIGIIVIIVSFAYWSGLIGAFLSDYKMYPIRWGTHISNEEELVKTHGYWMTEIIDNHYKLGSMLWIPYSDNASGFFEVSYYERKGSWCEIW